MSSSRYQIHMCCRLCQLLASWKCPVIAQDCIPISSRHVWYYSSSCKFNISFCKINKKINEIVFHICSKMLLIFNKKMLGIILFSMPCELNFLCFGIHCPYIMNNILLREGKRFGLSADRYFVFSCSEWNIWSYFHFFVKVTTDCVRMNNSIYLHLYFLSCFLMLTWSFFFFLQLFPFSFFVFVHICLCYMLNYFHLFPKVGLNMIELGTEHQYHPDTGYLRPY